MFARSAAGICCLLLAISVAAKAHAGQATCLPLPPEARLGLATELGRPASFERRPDVDTSIDRKHVLFVPHPNDGSMTVGYGHEYSIIDVDRIPDPTPVGPSSNGYLHTLYVPMQLQGESWQLRLQPALSISSNLLKEPDRITHDALQLNAALLGQWAASDRSHWLVGLCGDHRFGDYRIYPVVNRFWTNRHWSIRIGYPDTDIRLRLGTQLTTGGRVFPHGSQWLVHDADIGDSIFEHRAWQVELYLGWQFARRWRAELNVGKLLNSRYKFVLESGDAFRGDTQSPFQVRFELIRFFD